MSMSSAQGTPRFRGPTEVRPARPNLPAKDTPRDPLGWVAALLASPGCAAAHAAVAVYLSRLGSGDFAWPSNDVIARDCSLSLRRVQQVLNELESWGWIARTESPWRGADRRLIWLLWIAPEEPFALDSAPPKPTRKARGIAPPPRKELRPPHERNCAPILIEKMCIESEEKNRESFPARNDHDNGTTTTHASPEPIPTPKRAVDPEPSSLNAPDRALAAWESLSPKDRDSRLATARAENPGLARFARLLEIAAIDRLREDLSLPAPESPAPPPPAPSAGLPTPDSVPSPAKAPGRSRIAIPTLATFLATLRASGPQGAALALSEAFDDPKPESVAFWTEAISRLSPELVLDRARSAARPAVREPPRCFSSLLRADLDRLKKPVGEATYHSFPPDRPANSSDDSRTSGNAHATPSSAFARSTGLPGQYTR